MKKLSSLVAGSVLALGLLNVGLAGARNQATTIRVAAEMTAANETPTPKGT